MTETKPKFEVRLLGGTEPKRIKRPSVNGGTTNKTPLLTCIDCGYTKPRSRFYNSSHTMNGKQTYCRACHIVRLGQNPAHVVVQGPDTAFRDDSDPVVEVKPPAKESIGVGISSALAEKVRTEYRKRNNIHDFIFLNKSEIVHAVLSEWIGGDA